MSEKDEFGEEQGNHDIIPTPHGLIPVHPAPGFRGGPNDLRTTGHDCCMRPLNQINQANAIKILSHLNPVINSERFADVLNAIKENGEIVNEKSFNLFIELDWPIYNKENSAAPEAARIAKRLFKGGKYINEIESDDAEIYRIAYIEQMPFVEMATIIVPMPSFFKKTDLGLTPAQEENNLRIVRDMSLDILLKGPEDNFPVRTSLRIPTVARHRMVPEESTHKKFHLLAVRYTENGEEPRYINNYTRERDLNRGIARAIRRIEKSNQDYIKQNS